MHTTNTVSSDIYFIYRPRKLKCAELDEHKRPKKFFLLFFNLNMYSGTGAAPLYYVIMDGLSNGLSSLIQTMHKFLLG